MTAKIIDGLAIATEIKKEIITEIKQLGIKPQLDVILVGNNPASEIYVRKKVEACEEVGIVSKVWRFEESVDSRVITKKINYLNYWKGGSNGILLQLPLPKNMNSVFFFRKINPLKDVDVFHPENVGLLVQGRPRFRPCTPHGIQIMLAHKGIQVKGKHVCIINRSNIVGKPLSSMLIQDNDEYANATVTVCHDNTPYEELVKICRLADIVVVAVGIPGFLKAEAIKPGSVVIDVGINRVDDKIVGDVDVSCREVAGWVSKVPGGIGPLTICCLLKNTLLAAKLQIEHNNKLNRDIRETYKSVRRDI